MPKVKSVRLPHFIKPERYRIILHPDLAKFTFRGEETAYLNLRRPVSEITLHAKDLKIKTAEFRAKSLSVKPRRIAYDQREETVTFVFPQKLPAGGGELALEFQGELNDKMRGFYRSRYEVNGEARYMATTQFESTDARRAFPCVDEPSAKAVFDITLMVPGYATAISNTLPAEVREHESGDKIVRFLPTPKMSTYLLAFIVGEFEYVKTKTKEGVLVRVFVTPGKKHQAEFALEVAAKTLSFFTKYFNIRYPLPVMDLIAIPDFAAGAMENWGAVTYREAALLVDPEHSSTANKQWVAIVIAHELAHQWFGNLVTMEWWTHLWLNEGFASYIEYLAVDHLFPEWDIWTQFTHLDLGAALQLDALLNTHPIEVPVNHPSEIGEIFDAISYQKGSSIIRMLAEYLGKRDFRDGLRHYLKKHQYANARTEDLWRAFGHVSGKPVERIMRNWTGKGGYPVVTVSQKERGFQLSQSRFFSSVLSRRVSKDKTLWAIPINYRKKSSRAVCKFLLYKKSEMLSAMLKGGEWLKLNYDVSGVYRVDYPAEMLAGLAEGIERGELGPRDRLNVESDAFAMAEAGLLKTHEALRLSSSYKNETDYTVWASLSANLGHLEQLFFHFEWVEVYREFAKDIFAHIAKKIGWVKRPDEKHTDALLRSTILFNYGSYGDANTIRRAKKLFSGFTVSKNSIEPDLRGVVYNLVAEHGGKKEYELFLRRHRTETMHEEKNRIARALGRFRQKELLKRTLTLSLSKEVRAQDTFAWVGGVWANPKGRELAWGFTKKNWKVLVDRYGHGGHTLPRFIHPAGVFVTEEKAREISAFFKRHPAPGALRAIEQTIEQIRSNAALLRRDAVEVHRWLSERKVS